MSDAVANQDGMLVVMHGIHVVVPEISEEQRQHQDALDFWIEVNIYADAAWTAFEARDYEGQGNYNRGGGPIGFSFKSEGHHTYIMGSEAGNAITMKELFGPDEGPCNADEKWRYG